METNKNTKNQIKSIVDTAGAAIFLGILEWIFEEEKKSGKMQNLRKE